MKRLFALVTTLAFAGSAFAFHCPADMAKIDKALAAPHKLNEKQLAEVKKLRTDGEASHKAGKHQEAVDTLGKALKMLDVKP